MEYIREQLAEYAHQAWSGWMEYLFSKSEMNESGTCTIPKWAVERWQRQLTTDYHSLPDEEKQSDREEADKMLLIINNNEYHLATYKMQGGIKCPTNS